MDFLYFLGCENPERVNSRRVKRINVFFMVCEI
jgi:hypothetical protein